MNRELLLILALAAAISLIVFLLLARVRSRQTEAGSGETLLFPFDLSTFSNDALERSIRIARGSGATLLPTYLAVVPLRVSLEAPLPRHAERAIPMIDRIELAASSQGVRVDSSIESGRTLKHALTRIIEARQPDQTLIAAASRGQGGFSPDEIAWILDRVDCGVIVLKPARAVSHP